MQGFKLGFNYTMTQIIKHAWIVVLFFLSATPHVAGQELKTPVTKKEFNDNSSTFRFAIISDRTGGMREGVLAEAIDKLNLLQPEFVVSVGDLIDGYTEDATVWENQWSEFDSLVNKLEMPFYYAPGNHDVSNKPLTAAWRERHGKDYYHFVHKDVLFIVLNTDEIKDGGISTQQQEYLRKALNDNKNVHWTLVFMHRPLWSYGDKAGYETIEEALRERKHTLFSGHHHHYQYQVKNGMDHYVLATTGGGSWMRNPNVGEFDHITWVTMKKEGPHVAHLDLNGIYDKNIVPPEDYDDIQILRKGDWLQVKPVVHELSSFDEIELEIVVKNNMQRPMQIKGTLAPQQGLFFWPDTIEEALQPVQSSIIKVIAHSNKEKSLHIEELNNKTIEVALEAGFNREGKEDISLTTSERWLLDWKHTLKPTDKEVAIDGLLNDWDSQNFITVENPQFVHEDWDWKGAEDGKFAFSTKTDKENLYIAVKFEDEHLVSNKIKLAALQDKFYIHIDSSPLDGGEFYQLEFAAGKEITLPLMNEAALKIKGLKAAIVGDGNNQTLELKVPLKSIEAKSANAIRINIGIMDHDRPENTKPSVLWWRPLWNSDGNYEGSSTFYIKRDTQK